MVHHEHSWQHINCCSNSVCCGIMISDFSYPCIGDIQYVDGPPTSEVTPVHYCDVKMGVMTSQITSLTIVYSTVYSGVYQRKHRSFASLAFVWGIHRWPVNSPHKGSVTRKMFPFDALSCTSSHDHKGHAYGHEWSTHTPFVLCL